MDARVVDGAGVLRVLFRGDADKPVLVDIDAERVKAGDEHVHPDVELEMGFYSDFLGCSTSLQIWSPNLAFPDEQRPPDVLLDAGVALGDVLDLADDPDPVAVVAVGRLHDPQPVPLPLHRPQQGLGRCPGGVVPVRAERGEQQKSQ